MLWHYFVFKEIHSLSWSFHFLAISRSSFQQTLHCVTCSINIVFPFLISGFRGVGCAIVLLLLLLASVIVVSLIFFCIPQVFESLHLHILNVSDSYSFFFFLTYIVYLCHFSVSRHGELLSIFLSIGPFVWVSPWFNSIMVQRILQERLAWCLFLRWDFCCRVWLWETLRMISLV